jgi:hypothetical protein
MPNESLGIRNMPALGQRWRHVIAGAAIAMIAGCAHHYEGVALSSPYGFFSGMWHGFVFPYALLANLLSWLLSLAGVSFLSEVQIIGRPNTGVFFYYVGFALGVSVYGGGARAAVDA